MDKLIIITGPTAVGKTKCSLEIAKRFNTELINGDAYQVYKGMNIGTAKPTTKELSMIKHHMIDCIDPINEFDVSKYQTMVRGIIDDFIQNNKLPIIVGGSGLYLESIFLNYEFEKEEPDNNIDYAGYSNDELYSLLKDLNPEIANNIHPNNRKRVERALTKINQNESFSNKKDEMIYDTLVIFLNDDRDKLYSRINSRVDEMINDGLIEECKKLKNLPLSKTAKVAIGYKEIFKALDGEISIDEAIEEIKLNSRHYAKRQLTWFRNKSYITNVMIDVSNFNKTIDDVEKLIKDFLNK